MKIAMLCLVLLINGAVVVTDGYGQSSVYGKNTATVRSAFKNSSNKASRSTVEIRAGRSAIIHGTIVSKDGLIVTKASALQKATDESTTESDTNSSVSSIRCRVNDRDLVPEILATDEKTDLVLLKVPATGLVPIQWANRKPVSGQIVLSVDDDNTPVAIGMVSVDRQQFPMRSRSSSSSRPRIELGVKVKRNSGDDGVVVEQVYKKTPAELAGIRTGDILLSLDESKLYTRSGYQRILRKKKSGEKIQVRFLRNGVAYNVEARLARIRIPETKSAKSSSPYDQWGGGPFSERRFNFGNVIAHDSYVEPEDCGGPLLNSRGEAIGLNIARTLRVVTYAIPAKTVQDFVDNHRQRRLTSRD